MSLANGFVSEDSQAYERIRLVGVRGGAVAGTHLRIDGDRLVLEVDVRAEPPGVFHEFRVLEQDTSFSDKLTVNVFLLRTNGLPGDAVATELRSRDRQPTETIENGKGTILVHESLFDVVGRRWISVFREVDGTVGVGGRCQDARRHTRQAEVTLEQAPGLQDNEEDASEARRELVLVPIGGSDRTQLNQNEETTHPLQRRTSSSKTATMHFRPAGLRKPGIENKIASSIASENVQFQWLNFCSLAAKICEYMSAKSLVTECKGVKLPDGSFLAQSMYWGPICSPS